MDRLARDAPRAVGPVVEFCYGRLVANPHRVGQPLSRELTGLHSARVGPYRVVYRIDEDERAIVVVRVAHRSDVYRRG
jgi:mRNA-degrading endonuclease RelE of RelBE toxin-antitoxin system